MAGNEGRRTRRRAEWDNSLSDLSVYRLTNSELKRKGQLFKSKNLDAAKREMYRKTGSSLTTPTSSMSSRKSRRDTDSSATLEELLCRADQSLNAAQGLCSPKLYSVDPVITVAPHIQEKSGLNGRSIEWAGSPQVLPNIVSDNPSPVTPPTPNSCHEGCESTAEDVQQSTVVAKQLVQSIEEMKQANQLLLDTVYEQQHIIDTLAHDMLVMKQKYDQLHSIMTTIMQQQMPHPPQIINPLMDHRHNNGQFNSSYVPLPLYNND